jgi:hypothetical protein
MIISVFQEKLNNLLYITKDYNHNVFINNFAILFSYYYFIDWGVIEYTKTKVIWKNKITNMIDYDGKFIIKFLLTDFQFNLKNYEEYLKSLVKEYSDKVDNDGTDEVWKITQKISKIKNLYDIFLEKEFHDKLVYYMSILS